MVTLAISVAIAVCVSFACSLTEAGLLAVSPAYVRLLCERGSRIGRVLKGFQENMDRPIATILITNTIANVSMASLAGAAAYRVWGERGHLFETVILTSLILFFGEIIPKVLGVTYNRGVSTLYALPLEFVTRLFTPLIWVIGFVTSLTRGKEKVAKAPEEEVLAMAKISEEEGSILPIEKQIIMHALELNNVTAKQIMTPRTVLLAVDSEKTLEEVQDEAVRWVHSRIPVYEEEPDNLVGLILRRDVIAALAKEEDCSRPLKSLQKELHFVPEILTGEKLLAEFLTQKSHLFGVVDEYGEVLGIVTLEDVLETLIGFEIVDETDAVADMQELARRKWRQRLQLRARQNREMESRNHRTKNGKK